MREQGRWIAAEVSLVEGNREGVECEDVKQLVGMGDDEMTAVAEYALGVDVKAVVLFDSEVRRDVCRDQDVRRLDLAKAVNAAQQEIGSSGAFGAIEQRVVHVDPDDALCAGGHGLADENAFAAAEINHALADDGRSERVDYLDTMPMVGAFDVLRVALADRSPSIGRGDFGANALCC